MSLLGWGLDPEGSSSFGSSVTGTASLVSALAISTREVDVTVSELVQDSSAILPGDALNPSTWKVVRNDTGEELHPVNVVQVGPMTYRVMLLEEFASVEVTHVISSATLRDTAGALLGTPRSASFLGLLDENKASVDAALAQRKTQARDFANAQVPASPFEGGTLQLDPGGDYKTETGADLVRKLIVRRITSSPGDFFHLPDYGIGIRTKEPLPSSDLIKLKKEIERQVAREPEVESNSVSLSLDPRGILTIFVRAKLRKSGNTVDTAATIPLVGVVL